MFAGSSLLPFGCNHLTGIRPPQFSSLTTRQEWSGRVGVSVRTFSRCTSKAPVGLYCRAHRLVMIALFSTSCSSLEVDTSVCHDGPAVPIVAWECWPPCPFCRISETSITHISSILVPKRITIRARTIRAEIRTPAGGYSLTQSPVKVRDNKAGLFSRYARFYGINYVTLLCIHCYEYMLENGTLHDKSSTAVMLQVVLLHYVDGTVETHCTLSMFPLYPLMICAARLRV